MKRKRNIAYMLALFGQPGRHVRPRAVLGRLAEYSEVYRDGDAVACALVYELSRQVGFHDAGAHGVYDDFWAADGVLVLVDVCWQRKGGNRRKLTVHPDLVPSGPVRLRHIAPGAWWRHT